jgi:hypothetical protein
MRILRLLAAFSVTPLLAALVFAVGQPLLPSGGPAISFSTHLFGGLLMAGPPAYALALILGVPAYFALEALGRFRFWLVSFLGAAAGSAVGFWAFGTYPAQALLCGLGGLVAAATFWVVVSWPPDKSLKPTRSAGDVAHSRRTAGGQP